LILVIVENFFSSNFDAKSAMRTGMWFAVAVVGGAVIVGGCSKDRKLERQLRGTWNASGSTPTQQKSSSH